MRHAFRVAIGLLVPGLILLEVGRPDLIVFAAFGSFAGMYGRGERLLPRLRHQVLGGILLLAGVTVGIVLVHVDDSQVATVAAAVPFAVVASLVADRLGLRPQGPFFGLFALGAIAAVPADKADPVLAWSLCAGSALFAIILGLLESLVTERGFGQREAWIPTRERDAGILQAVRYALAVGCAGTVGLACHLDHVNWALAGAAVTLTADDRQKRVQRGVHRVLGTVVGLAVTGLLLIPQLGPTALAALVIAFLFPTELFMARNYALALGFFTPMIMLMTDLATPADPRTLIVDRGVGTLLGVAAGIVVSVMVREPLRESPSP